MTFRLWRCSLLSHIGSTGAPLFLTEYFRQVSDGDSLWKLSYVSLCSLSMSIQDHDLCFTCNPTCCCLSGQTWQMQPPPTIREHSFLKNLILFTSRHWSHLYIFCTCSAVRFLQIFWNSCKEKMIMLSLFMALTMKFSASSCLRCTGFVFFFQVSVPSPLLWPHRPHSCPYSWTAFQLYFPDNLFPGMGWGTICTQNLGIARKGGGSASCQDFFGGFVHNALRALQSDHFPPKVCPFPPEYII